ncbi:MAG: FAD-binding oxidoreductase, partial [Anaerolineae bacterium]|nr:FAD-binding oxidoreductase [Anaerolineae bacterium]
MKRWQGWGDDAFLYPLPQSAIEYLNDVVGPGMPLRNVTLDEMTASVPASRLPEHPLVNTDPEERLRHCRGQSFPDWVAMYSGEIEAYPDGVAYPTTTEEVRALIAYAQQCGAQLIPYGGGTSVVGHINPLPGDAPVLTIDMGRMNRLVKFEEESNLATFGAGVSGPDLEAQLRARGRTLGHYPQSFEYSTLGGWIATRSSGQQSLAYGRIENMFAGGLIETPAGTLEIPAHIPASAAGPDLRELILGSEGRLGIITEATVRALPLPEYKEYHAVFFPDFELGRAAARAVMQAKIPLSMMRLSTAMETETTLAMAGHPILLGGLEQYLAARGAADGKCMLIFSTAGREAVVRIGSKEALGITGQYKGVYGTQVFAKQWHKNRFKSPYLRNALWDAGYAIDTLETAIDWDHIPGLVADIETALRTTLLSIDEFVHVFTHLSRLYPHGSSIYVQYLFRCAETPGETLARWRLLKAAASKVIVEHGATISHQHGVGVDHLPYLAAEKGDLGMQVLENVTKLFDPDRIMNPGKLI